MNGTVTHLPAFPTWDDKHRDASRIVDQACGWGESVDQSDDAELARWAREYLPMVLSHGRREVTR